MSQQGFSPDGLILQSAALARAAPQAWTEFLSELRKANDARQKECVQAPLAMLQVAQGRAQNSAQLLDLFENALATAKRITQT